MPRQNSSKRATGSKPYPKPPPFSAAQTEKIVKALMLVLNATDNDDDEDNNEQTTYSEDKEGSQGEQEQEMSTPATLSASSSDTSLLQAALAPLEATLQDSLDKLHQLPTYLAKFVANNNTEGIEKANTLLVRHEAIVTETETKIATLKDAWAAEERTKKQAAKEAHQRALGKKEAVKSKGKAIAARSEEDEEFAELAGLAMEMEIPEGDLPFSLRTKKTCSDLESLDALLANDDLLVNGSHAPSGSPHTPTNLKHRFPDKRVLPQGFSLAKAQTIPKLSPGPQSPPVMPKAGPSFTPMSNAFGESALEVPNDFSPSKVKGALVAVGPKIGKKAAKGAKPKTGVSSACTGLRQMAWQSYKDKGEDEEEDAIGSAIDQED